MITPRLKGEDRPFKHNLHIQVDHPSAHEAPIDRHRPQWRKIIQDRRDRHIADLDAASQAMADADQLFTQASHHLQAENFTLATPRPHRDQEGEVEIQSDYDNGDHGQSHYPPGSFGPEGLWLPLQPEPAAELSPILIAFLATSGSS